eukprot:635497-Amphidinium_carterae.1
MAVETILEAETILENQIVLGVDMCRKLYDNRSTMQQKILNWVRDATKKIGTWHLDAASWFEQTVKDAKRMHTSSSHRPLENNVQSPIEKKYVLGRSAPIPRPEHALESVACCKVLDVLPKWLRRQVLQPLAEKHAMERAKEQQTLFQTGKGTPSRSAVEDHVNQVLEQVKARQGKQPPIKGSACRLFV